MTEWIKVSDELPSDGFQGFTWNGRQVLAYAIFSKHLNKWFYYDLNGVREVNITHWMPLPKPPEDQYVD
jgi:hypothetical protein